MKKTFRAISAILAVAMSISMAACSKVSGNGSDAKTSEKAETTTAKENDPILTGTKPDLKILTMYQAYNFEEQPAFKTVQELTGYKIQYFTLPQENPEQKLLLEISSGADYDLLYRVSPTGYAQLSAQNALIPLNNILDKYGSNLKSAVSDIAWEAVTDSNGNINAVPYEGAAATTDDPYGAFTSGIAVRSDMLDELGLKIPTTLDEFTSFLEAAKAKYGISPITSNKLASSPTIQTAFGLGGVGYKDGKWTPGIKNPGMVEYLAYMQKLYKEKLLDNDFAINTADNSKEKFTSKNAIAYEPAYFWDIPALKTALATSNPDCKVKFITSLAKDKNTKPVVGLAKGINGYFCISQNSKNPEHAINYLNILSTKENFQKVYVGEEGKSFEIKDGKYYPIFSNTAGGFADYTNSDKLTGIVSQKDMFTMWQARARKTTEMAEVYEEMNSRIDDYTFKTTLDTYANNTTETQQYNTALNAANTDALLKAIVEGTDPKKAVADIQDYWDKNGGLELEKAMQEYYDKHTKYLD